MNQPRKLTNDDFFRLLARRGLEHVHVSESLDPETKGILNHVLDATLEQLSDSADVEAAEVDDDGVVIVECEE